MRTRCFSHTQSSGTTGLLARDTFPTLELLVKSVLGAEAVPLLDFPLCFCAACTLNEKKTIHYQTETLEAK